MVCAVAGSVVYQVALLLSNNSLQHSEQYCTLGHFAHCLFQFIPIYPNLFEFILNFVKIFCKKRAIR